MIELTYPQIHQLDIVPLCYFDVPLGEIDKEVETETVAYTRCANRVVPVINICVNMTADDVWEMPYFCPIRKKIVSGSENPRVTEKSYMMSVAVLGKTVETRDGTTFDRVCYANISDYEQCAGTVEDAKDILLPTSIFEAYPDIYDTIETTEGFSLVYPSLLERDIKNYNDGEYLQAYQYIYFETHNNYFCGSVNRPVVRFCDNNDNVVCYMVEDIEGGGILSDNTILHFTRVVQKECFYDSSILDMLIYDCKNRRWTQVG